MRRGGRVCAVRWVIVEIGVVALVVALAAGTVLSVLKHRYDGRFRRVRTARHPSAGPARTSPRSGTAPIGDASAEPTDDERGGIVLTEGELGEPLGQRVTLLQFSSVFCAPCRATHRILADVARMVDGVRHVEIDAESNLDLVRRLDIMRTPTVLVLDAGGELVTRASGQPRKVDVIAAVGKAVERVTQDTPSGHHQQ